MGEVVASLGVIIPANHPLKDVFEATRETSTRLVVSGHKRSTVEFLGGDGLVIA